MMILTIRTDNPEAEIGLFEGSAQQVYKKWTAHRQLAETIHKTIEEVLQSQSKTWKDLQGLVIFEGPGSFTGLRIGMTVANTIAFDLAIPIVAAGSEEWIQTGIRRLQAGEQDEIALPHYGRDANITAPRK